MGWSSFAFSILKLLPPKPKSNGSNWSWTETSDLKSSPLSLFVPGILSQWWNGSLTRAIVKKPDSCYCCALAWCIWVLVRAGGYMEWQCQDQKSVLILSPITLLFAQAQAVSSLSTSDDQWAKTKTPLSWLLPSVRPWMFMALAIHMLKF